MINQMPSQERFAKGPVALFECFQQIPCNPCAEACPQGAITVQKINDCPILDVECCNARALCIREGPRL